MAEYRYSRFNPAGNTTLFLHENHARPENAARTCASALLKKPAEQAGFVNAKKHMLTMAGGEFCANACRAFGAMLDMQAKSNGKPSELRKYTMLVSGCGFPVRLFVRGQYPRWQVRATFPPGKTKVQMASGGIIVHMRGISHLLLPCDDFPDREEAAAIGHKLARRHRLHKKDAAGVVWTKGPKSRLEILPYVEVPKLGTAMIESSCASASIAAALCYGENGYSCIVQPCGEILQASCTRNFSVAGNVDFLDSGGVGL